MSIAEYVSVFVAIILGLAVADLATSFHRLMRARERVAWDWISLALASVMLMETVLFWWGSFYWYRAQGEVSIGMFLPDLVLFLLLFLAVAAVLPDEVPAEGLSLRRHYFSTAPYFWTLLVLISLATMFNLERRHAGDPLPVVLARQWPNIALAIAMVPLIVSKRPWLHKGFVALLVPYTLWTVYPYVLH
jgi:hypothetical protein